MSRARQAVFMTTTKRLGTSLAVLVITLASSLSAAAETADSATPPYQVREGKVDRPTYLGWRVFHSTCHGCHGVDATGTSVAPNLVDRIDRMTARQFSLKVLTRYRIVLGSSELAGDDQTAMRDAMLEQVMRRERGELLMPAWGHDPNVKPHVLDIYAYLRARGDGVLGPGRPEQLAE